MKRLSGVFSGLGLTGLVVGIAMFPSTEGVRWGWLASGGAAATVCFVLAWWCAKQET